VNDERFGLDKIPVRITGTGASRETESGFAGFDDRASGDCSVVLDTPEQYETLQDKRKPGR